MSGVGLRKAALTLAALHPEDRSWLIDRLRPTWRKDVRRLIGEIPARNISDTGLVREAIQSSERDLAPDPPAPDRLMQGLQGLSPSWCARVLAACAPDHVEMVIANRAAGEADLIRTELMVLPSAFPSKLAEALAHLVRARCERCASPVEEAVH